MVVQGGGGGGGGGGGSRGTHAVKAITKVGCSCGIRFRRASFKASYFRLPVMLLEALSLWRHACYTNFKT